MTTYKMPKQPIDDIKTKKWSISFLSSVGGAKRYGGALAIFDLFNRTTNRAHRMTISAGGKGFGLGASFRHTGYAKFETEIAANFSDFHGRWAELEIKDRIGRSWRDIKIFQRGGAETLMELEVNNWNLTGWFGFNGKGMTEVYFSDGRPVGNPDYELNLDLRTREPLPDKYQIRVTDFGVVLRLPGDVLFDFDKDWLHHEAAQRVSDAMDYINALPKTFKRLEVHGHTDSMERAPGYNMDLSRRRAKTVTDYFTKYKHGRIHDLKIEPPVGRGATEPMAPNSRPDGADNPAGREQNRRVEIILYHQ